MKVNAYANLYAAIIPGVDFAELSLTFVENRHPRKLLRYLTGTRGYTVEETSPGIYLVSGDYLPIQMGAYLDVIIRANRKAFLEAINMASEELPSLEEIFEEAGLLPGMIERSLDL